MDNDTTTRTVSPVPGCLFVCLFMCVWVTCTLEIGQYRDLSCNLATLPYTWYNHKQVEVINL